MELDETKERTDSFSLVGVRPLMRSKETPWLWRVVARSGGEDQDWREGRRRLNILRARAPAVLYEDEEEGETSQPQVVENQDLRPEEAAEGVVEVVEPGVMAEERVSEWSIGIPGKIPGRQHPSCRRLMSGCFWRRFLTARRWREYPMETLRLDGSTKMAPMTPVEVEGM